MYLCIVFLKRRTSRKGDRRSKSKGDDERAKQSKQAGSKRRLPEQELNNEKTMAIIHDEDFYPDFEDDFLSVLAFASVAEPSERSDIIRNCLPIF